MADGSNALYISSQNGHTATVEFLLRDLQVEVDVPRDTGATAFLIACEEGHAEKGGVRAPPQAQSLVRRR